MNKKRFLNWYIILFYLVSYNSKAQNEWFPLGAKWYVNNHDIGDIYISRNCHSYDYYEVIKDTLVLGLNSKKVISKFYRCNDKIIENPSFIVREEDRKVYYFEENDFKLMYDFNLNVGDVLDIPIINWVCDSVDKAIVDSISTIEINGKVLIQQHLKIKLYNSFYEYQKYTITELIGRFDFDLEYGSSNKSLIFKPIGDCSPGPFGFFPTKLRCYEDNNIQFKQNVIFNYNTNQLIDAPCDTIVDLPVNTLYIKANAIHVSPNPATDFIRLELEDENNSIQILNAQGQVVYQEKTFEKILNIHTHNFASGIYFVIVSNQNGNISKGQVSKNLLGV